MRDTQTSGFGVGDPEAQDTFKTHTVGSKVIFLAWPKDVQRIAQEYGLEAFKITVEIKPVLHISGTLLRARSSCEQLV